MLRIIFLSLTTKDEGYFLNLVKGGKIYMQEEVRNNTYSGGPLSGLFRNCGCNNNGCGCGGDSTILFFLIVFLLLFTNFGCCCNNN